MNLDEFNAKWQDESVNHEQQKDAAMPDPVGHDTWKQNMSRTQENEDVLRAAYMASHNAESAAANPQPETADAGPAPRGAEEQETPGIWKQPKGPSPSTVDLVKNKDWLDNARKYYELDTGKPWKGTDEALSNEVLDKMSAFNWNTLYAGSKISDILSHNPDTKQEYAKAFLNLMSMYNWSDGGYNEFGRSLKWMGLDPVTYAGLGVGSLATKGLARAAIKEGSFTLLKRLAETAAAQGAVAGGLEGAGLGGLRSVMNQTAEVQAGAKKDISAGEVATGAGEGALFGGILGGAAGGTLQYLSKRMQSKIEAEAAAQNHEFNGPAPKPETPEGSASFPEGGSTVAAGAGEGAGPPIEIKPGETPTEEQIRQQAAPEQQVPEKTGEWRPQVGEYVTVGDQVGQVTDISSNGWHTIKLRDGTETKVRPSSDQTIQPMSRFVQNHPEIKNPTDANIYYFQNDPETQAAVHYMAERDKFYEGKPATITDEEAIAAAAERSKLKDITGQSVDARWTREDIIGLGVTISKQMDDLKAEATRLTAKMDAGIKLSTEEMAHYTLLDTRAAATVETLHGVASDKGNELRAFQTINKALASKDEFAYYKAIQQTVDERGGPGTAEQRIRLMANPEKNKDIKSMIKAQNMTWGQRSAKFFLQLRYNMMLSSFKTQGVNLLGHLSVNAYESFFVSPTKIAINNASLFLREALGGEVNPAERLSWMAWKNGITGAAQATRESFALAKQIALGQAVDAGKAFPGEEFGKGKLWNELGLRYHTNDVPKSMLGKAGTLPMRSLEAVDAFFKHQTMNMSIYEQSYNMALAENVNKGLKGAELRDAVNARFKDLVENPTEQMVQVGNAEAAKRAMTSKGDIYGSVIGTMTRLAAEGQKMNPVFGALVPFVRTPMNVVGYAIEQSPLRAAIAPIKTAQEIMSKDVNVRSEALARFSLGTGIMMMAYEWHKQGVITGQGSNHPEVRRAQEGTGWTANAIKVGGEYYDMSRLDPGSLILDITATAMDRYYEAPDQKVGADVLLAGALSIADLIKDRSPLSSLADLTKAILAEDPKGIRRLTSGWVGSFVEPGIVRDVKDYTDAQQHSLSTGSTWDTTLDSIDSAYPIFSKNVPAQRMWDGQVKMNDGSPVFRAFIPVKIHDDISHTDKSAAALAYSQTGVAKPDSTIKLAGGMIDLMAVDGNQGWVYDKYQQFVGQARRQLVDSFVKSDQFKAFMTKDATGRDQMGPNSEGANVLAHLVARGNKIGTAQMIDWLTKNKSITTADGKNIELEHALSVPEYSALLEEVKSGKAKDTDWQGQLPQYKIKDRPYSTPPSLRFGL